jgi:hypothetical protein
MNALKQRLDAKPALPEGFPERRDHHHDGPNSRPFARQLSRKPRSSAQWATERSGLQQWRADRHPGLPERDAPAPNAKESPNALSLALRDAKGFLTSSVKGAWEGLCEILKSEAAQKTISAIAEGTTKAAIAALIGGA